MLNYSGILPSAMAIMLIGIGPLLIFLNEINCGTNLFILHITKFSDISQLADAIAKEFKSEVKRFGELSFRIDIPGTNQFVIVSRPQKNTDRVWISIQRINEKNVSQTKVIVDRINRVLERIKAR